MSRLHTILQALAGDFSRPDHPEVEPGLTVQTSGGQEMFLRPQGRISEEAMQTLMTGIAPSDAPIISGPTRDASTGQQLSLLSEDELISIGAAERDPSTGQLVRPGTGNPMTAARGFDQRIVQRYQNEITQNAVADRQKAISLNRDLEALHQGYFVDGAFGDDQVAGVLDKLESKYSAHMLLQNELYRQFRGKDAEFKQMQQAQLAQAAEVTGTPVEYWQPSDSGPQFNSNLAAAANFGSVLRERAAKPAMELAKMEKEKVDRTRESRIRQIYAQLPVFMKAKNPQAGFEFVEREVQKANDWADGEYRRIAGGNAEAAPAPQTAAPQAAPATPQLTHPELPAGVPIFARYNTWQDAQNANVPNDSYAIIEGQLLRKNALGQWE